MKLDTFDVLDRQILTALQINARAPFRQIAEVLGTSDQTVARRYGRMRSSGRIRILGLSNPDRLGEVSWFLRARTTPGAAVPIAEALARRPDTSWVSITSGGTEVVCSTRARDLADSSTLLLGKLPRTQQIVDVGAQQLLHVFYGYASSPLLKTGALSPAQVQALRPDPVAEPAAPGGQPAQIDATDRVLLELLSQDGRTPVEELVARAAVPATTVRRRISALWASGVLYFDIDYDQSTLEIGAPTLVWLNVSPQKVAAVGQALATQPEVAFAAATTGRTNVYASLLPTSPAALYAYTTGPLAALPGVREIETQPVIRAFKGAGSLNPLTLR